MFILDTDIVSHLQRGHAKVLARAKSLSEPELATTIVTRIEMLRARFDFLLKASDAAQLKKAQHWIEETERLLATLQVMPVTEGAAMHFETLKSMKGLGRIGRPDLLIACFALAYDAVLVTRNTKDFVRIPNLKLENWLDD